MIIGLFGALINNSNMGCLALTFSQILLLEEISSEIGIPFEYYVFEGLPNDELCRRVEKTLGIKKGNIKSYNVKPLFRLRRFVHHFIQGIESLNALRNCDICIDLTAGDSFTDLYGQYTFDAETNVKLLVEKMGIPLILGPQTYGPFNSEKNVNKAKKAIERAHTVISRDQKSSEYLKKYISKEIFVTTDLAFSLPYEKKEEQSSNKIKVGINVSGLLIKEKTEATELNFELMTDYEKYVVRVIDWLFSEDKYEVYFIPHVGNDGYEWLNEVYEKKIHYLGPYKDPITAKTDIASMDIFIGSRMHATIGAFSSGVCTIPVAYSRKFNGLFEHINYECVIDLTNMTTDKAFEKTINYIEEYDNLKEKVMNSMTIINTEIVRNKELYIKVLKECLSCRN